MRVPTAALWTLAIACTSNEPALLSPAVNARAVETANPAVSASASASSVASTVPVASSAPSALPAASAPQPPACPPEMAHVGRSCVDKWEAHLVVVADGGAVAPYSPYERPAQGVRYEARSALGVVPQAYISRSEAHAACDAAGKRLCSLHEWYRACRGPRGFMYPYGPQMTKGACNASKHHLLSRIHGTNPHAWKYDEHFNDPKLNQEPGFLAKTGEYEQCVSGYGVADMVGNLHEWISDTVDASLENKIPLRDDIRKKIEKNTGHGIFMGGFYSTTSEHGRGCAFVTIGHEPKYHDYSTGFRCCKGADRTAKSNP